MTETQAGFSAEFKIEDFMQDAQGRLVHVDNVKEIDKTRDELVRYIVRNALALQKEMIEFKANSLSQFQAFLDISASEYDVAWGGTKGNVTLRSYDGRYKIQMAVSEDVAFDERLQVAKKMIDDCLNRWTEGSRSEIKTLINDAFSVNQEGKINTRSIMGLRRLNIDDEMWRRAMEVISDSLNVVGSKQYMRIYERVGEDQWKHITLDIASIAIPADAESEKADA